MEFALAPPRLPPATSTVFEPPIPQQDPPVVPPVDLSPLVDTILPAPLPYASAYSLDPLTFCGPAQAKDVLDMPGEAIGREHSPERSLLEYRPDTTPADATPPKVDVQAPRTPQKRKRGEANAGTPSPAKVSSSLLNSS